MGVEATADPNACLRCGATLRSLGVEPFRTGGHVGAAKFFLGELGEIGEAFVPLEVLVCDACRYVEFRAPTG